MLLLQPVTLLNSIVSFWKFFGKLWDFLYIDNHAILCIKPI